MNNTTTLGSSVFNTSRCVKIESKKTNAKYVPYFFSTIKKSNNDKGIDKNKSIKEN